MKSWLHHVVTEKIIDLGVLETNIQMIYHQRTTPAAGSSIYKIYGWPGGRIQDSRVRGPAFDTYLHEQDTFTFTYYCYIYTKEAVALS